MALLVLALPLLLPPLPLLPEAARAAVRARSSPPPLEGPCGRSSGRRTSATATF